MDHRRAARALTRASAFTAVALAAVLAAALVAGLLQALLGLTSAIALGLLLAALAGPAVAGAAWGLAVRLDPAPWWAAASAGVVFAGAVVALLGWPGRPVTAAGGGLVVAVAGLAGIRTARRPAAVAERRRRSRSRHTPGVPGAPGEAGATSAEYVGVVVLVAALLAALALTPAGTMLRDGLRAALCSILGQGCEAGQLSGEPSEPCVARRLSHSGRVDLSVVVDIGRQLGYDTSYLSDGSVEVTYDRGDDVGTGVGVGLHAELSWGSDTYQAGGKAGASVKLAVAEGQVWKFTGADAAEQAAQWIQWHAVDTGVADAAMPGGRDGLLGQTFGLAHRIGNGALNIVGLGDDHPSTPETVARYYEGGIDLGASASGGIVAADATVEAAATRAIGHRVDADGHTTVYLQVDTSAGAEIDDELSGGGARARWAADGVMAVTVDRDRRPVRAQLTAYRVDEPGLWLEGETDPTAVLGDGLFGESAPSGDGRTPPSLYQVDVALDLTDPDQAATFGEFLATGTSTLALGTTAGVPDPLAAAFFERGQTTLVEYDSTENNYGGNVMLQAIGRGGGGVEYRQSEMNIANAYYYDRDAGTYDRWSSCTS